MNTNIIYSDDLVEITNDSILLRGYYFPFGSKRISFSEIESISVENPTLLKGKYRLYGSGDLRTWFLPDWKRPVRDRLFFIRLKNKWRRVGLSVEDSVAVESILKEKGLIVTKRRAA